MHKRTFIFAAFVILSGCQHGGAAVHPVKSQGQNHNDWNQPVHRCHSGDEIKKCRRCLNSEIERIAPLAHDLSQLTLPNEDYWYSIWLDLKSVQKRYSLSNAEAACLKNQFCDKTKNEPTDAAGVQ